ncbi:MAG: hypothetical protein IT376_13820 [Polyangiaceae bacterium]|nr:hypothetical protein [Polyangiaceae bacterium]
MGAASFGSISVTVRVGREGWRWFAAAIVETPGGPVLLTARADEREALEELLARLRGRGGTSGVFGKLGRRLRRMARRVARSQAVRAVARQAARLARNPLVRAAIRHATTPLKLAKRALSGVTNNPLWSIAATGASFIPGVGSAVSAGMATAAALGRGASLKDAALAAVKNALPGGPVAGAAFDVAVGLAHGERIDEAALAAARSQVPGGELGRAAFDAALETIKTKSVAGVPALMARAAVQQAGTGPLWDKLASGPRLVPGLGAVTSAGMAAAIALGRRRVGSSRALTSALVSLPAGSAARAAFEAGVGVAQGRALDASALKRVRLQLPRGELAQAAFSAGVAAARAEPGSAGAVKALARALPAGPIRARMVAVAARAALERTRAAEMAAALRAARKLVAAARRGEEGAKERLHALALGAQGDSSARLALGIVRRVAFGGGAAGGGARVVSRDSLQAARARLRAWGAAAGAGTSDARAGHAVAGGGASAIDAPAGVEEGEDGSGVATRWIGGGCERCAGCAWARSESMEDRR